MEEGGAEIEEGGADWLSDVDPTLTGPWELGELKSFAELLEEVKDGDDREDSEDVTAGKRQRQVQRHKETERRRLWAISEAPPTLHQSWNTPDFSFLE